MLYTNEVEHVEPQLMKGDVAGMIELTTPVPEPVFVTVKVYEGLVTVRLKVVDLSARPVDFPMIVIAYVFGNVFPKVVEISKLLILVGLEGLLEVTTTSTPSGSVPTESVAGCVIPAIKVFVTVLVILGSPFTIDLFPPFDNE